MKTSIVAGSLLAALSLVAPLQAQQVAADVVVRSGPVAGRVVVGDGYSTYRRPVVYRRVPARVIVVERVVRASWSAAARKHWQPRRATGRWCVYYRDGRYYDRYVRGWPAMREVVVYERTGGYYHECDDDAIGTTATTTPRPLRRPRLGRLTCPCAFRRVIAQIQVGSGPDIPAHRGDVCVFGPCAAGSRRRSAPGRASTSAEGESIRCRVWFEEVARRRLAAVLCSCVSMRPRSPRPRTPSTSAATRSSTRASTSRSSRPRTSTSTTTPTSSAAADIAGRMAERWYTRLSTRAPPRALAAGSRSSSTPPSRSSSRPTSSAGTSARAPAA